MQIHPQFKKYRELSRVHFLVDDRSVRYDLVEFSAEMEDKGGEAIEYLPTGKVVKHKTIFHDVRHLSGYVVCSHDLERFANGATAYEDTLYWRSGHALKDFTIDGLVIKEIYDIGNNAFFDKGGVNTKFVITRVKLLPSDAKHSNYPLQAP